MKNGSKTSAELVSLVISLSLVVKSVRKIAENLFERGAFISKTGITRTFQNVKLKASGITKPEKQLPSQNFRSTRCRLINRVKKAVLVCNPPTQVSLARTMKVSRATIQRILKDDLGLMKRKKTKTHSLTEKQAAQRLDRGNEFLQYLTPRKLRYIFTFDETYVTLDDTAAETDYYYAGEDVEIPEHWQKFSKKAWLQRIMVAMGICWCG